MEITYTEEELPVVASKLLETFQTSIWLFDGEMGAGKTTLIKKICLELGVTDDMSSPTFSIINQYQTAKDLAIYHFDFYRLTGVAEALDIGAEDYFFSGDRCFIEWPEIIRSLLPSEYLEISIILVDSKTRHLTAHLNGSTR